MRQSTFFKLTTVFFILCFFVCVWVMNRQQDTIDNYSALVSKYAQDLNDATEQWHQMYSTMSQENFVITEEKDRISSERDQLVSQCATYEAELSALRLNEQRYQTSLGLMTQPAYVLTHDEVVLLAKVVQLEAGPSVDVRGNAINTASQKYITKVILNRVVSPSFPDNVHDVVYQKNQFSVVGSIDSEVIEVGTLLNIYDVLLHNGADDLPSYVCYFYADYIKDQWINTLPVYMTCGGTVFAYDKKEV